MIRLAIVILLAAAGSAVACDSRNFRGNNCGARNFRGNDAVVVERETVIRRGFFGRERSRSSVTRSFR